MALEAYATNFKTSKNISAVEPDWQISPLMRVTIDRFAGSRSVTIHGPNGPKWSLALAEAKFLRSGSNCRKSVTSLVIVYLNM